MVDAGLIEEVAIVLDATPKRAAAIIAAAEPLWRALEPSVDSYGGAEFDRVFLEAIKTIYCEANPLAAAARGMA